VDDAVWSAYYPSDVVAAIIAAVSTYNPPHKVLLLPLSRTSLVIRQVFTIAQTWLQHDQSMFVDSADGGPEIESNERREASNYHQRQCQSQHIS